ncbi:MAG: HAD family hydrolase [Bacilli bacterium]|nr:HAD family hydrolase [Bacilli bacterium]
MFKRIIFDLDFTLLMWKDEYVLNIKNVLEKHHIDADYKVIDEIIDEQEVKYDNLSKLQLLLDINDRVNTPIHMDILDEILEGQKQLSDIDIELVSLLQYLSSKYELVVFTNYFTDVQKARLEHAQLLPYIKEVIGGDMIEKFKPHESGFIKAMGPYTAAECLMVGDSVRCDINGAKEVGMKSILVDCRHKYPDYEGWRIESIYDLKEML